MENGRTFEDDVSIAERLEKILKPTQTRKDIFNTLWKIHNDISSFTTKDLLRRDLKIVKTIPIAGVPMLVKCFLARSDAFSAISSLAEDYNTHTVVLVGIDASGVVKRDIAIYSTENTFLSILIDLLKNPTTSTENDLQLSECEVKLKNVTYFMQNNIKLTRKFILPLVSEAFLLFKNNKS